MPKMRIERNADSGIIRFSGEYTESELRSLRLDNFDKAVLAQECVKSSDMLLNLELIFRRHEEQNTDT